MSTPRIATADALDTAIIAPDGPINFYDDDWSSLRLADVALASLRQHRDEIARVLREHQAEVTSSDALWGCDCGVGFTRHHYSERWSRFHAHQADAVLDYLTGGAS